jgi:hypothetical protein
LYTHTRFRSAYRSLKNNLPWLFIWHDIKDVKIPNTTNAIDGHFADLKTNSEIIMECQKTEK